MSPIDNARPHARGGGHSGNSRGTQMMMPAWSKVQRHRATTKGDDDSGADADRAEILLNVVVEIPAGQTAKIEYDTDSHRWTLDRVVDFLPYPCNYGFVPCTLAGDGDPIDVLLLGNAVGSGTVVHARPVAVMRMIDGGKPDDKVVAVPPHGLSPMADGVEDLADIEAMYPGVTEVLRVWFSNYKRVPGKVQIRGFEDARAAVRSIDEAEERFWETQSSASSSSS
jgi:inorganic pyrophosphatase